MCRFRGLSHEPQSETIEAAEFTLLVKSISEEGSVGIARASIVNDEKSCRTRRVHSPPNQNHAIASSTRRPEIYVSVM